MRSGDEIFEFDSENDEIETEYDANYPEDEDEDENALWDDGEDTADADTEIELTSKAQRQIARERRLIDELEADAAENPIEDENSDEDSERKKLKRELQAEALARLEDAARTVSDFGTSWMPIVNAESDTMNSAEAVTIFHLTMVRQKTDCSFPTL